ncbi:integrase core domain-containing protein [Bradyrhizobium nanningense]|uniref:integrase core domain-containing protein n=1 Tax=Bradyrhizobium nanningense TaxID=1325118 RepID=UPI001008CE84
MITARKATDNAFIEALTGHFPAECLNSHWFLSLTDAEAQVETWRRYCNEERPIGRSAIESLLAVKPRLRIQPPRCPGFAVPDALQPMAT